MQYSRYLFGSHGMTSSELVMHSNNGAPKKSATMLAMMERLGVTGSFSRPSVSNDNPFSKAIFKTLKYVSMYPNEPFKTLEFSRQWVMQFVIWYNKEHRHSGIRYVTLEEKHTGKDVQILGGCSKTFKGACARTPLRWSRHIRNWEPITDVTLNPETPIEEEKKAA